MQAAAADLQQAADLTPRVRIRQAQRRGHSLRAENRGAGLGDEVKVAYARWCRNTGCRRATRSRTRSTESRCPTAAASPPPAPAFDEVAPPSKVERASSRSRPRTSGGHLTVSVRDRLSSLPTRGGTKTRARNCTTVVGSNPADPYLPFKLNPNHDCVRSGAPEKVLFPVATVVIKTTH